jgi:hypothetical protein
VKSKAPPLTLLRAVRMQLTAVDPEQQSYSATEELDSWITNQQEWQQEHLAAWIFGVFGGLGLALAAVGLYSVVSYTVAQRTNEFGVRIAMGAQPGHLLQIFWFYCENCIPNNRHVLWFLRKGLFIGVLRHRTVPRMTQK